MKKIKKIELPVELATEHLIRCAGKIYGYNLIDHQRLIIASGLSIKKYSEVLRCYQVNPNFKHAFWTAYEIDLAISVTSKII